MSRRYLVTGAQGLVGRYLVAHLLDAASDSEVIGIGRSPGQDETFTHLLTTPAGPRPAPVPPEVQQTLSTPRYRYARVALSDGEALRTLLRELRPHCVFHLASALHSAPERELFETNVEGTSSLMKAVAQELGAGVRVVLGSSGSVYGEPTSVPIPESAPCDPAELYGLSKLTAEHLTRIAATRAGFSFVCARIFNVVGPGQSEGHVCARFASQLVTAEARGGGVLEVGALDTTRDFVDVRDVAAALAALAEDGAPNRAYNVGTGEETAIHAVVSELMRISGLAGRVEVLRRQGHPAGVRRHVAEVSRLRALGFRRRFELARSLENLWRYHRALASGGTG